MQVVGIGEARTRLSQLIREAHAGEEVLIARRGVPVARLVPVRPPRKPANVMKIEYIAPDFDAIDPEIIGLFEGD